jgi:tRNA (cytidine32/uridine32-2'-O)-methyltransferase
VRPVEEGGTLNRIKIVMVGTTHPGNIGAAARAMRNMGLSSLVLVDPQCQIDETAYARSSGAEQILHDCQRYATLAQALSDCHFVAATTARQRTLQWPSRSPRQLAQDLASLPPNENAAVVFGREHSGLSNDELQHCQVMVNIPTAEDFSSLNVASAIQVIAYEIRCAWLEKTQEPVQKTSSEPRASNDELEGYFTHLEQVLVTTGFLDPDCPRQMMKRLRRLYLRAEPTRNEVNILRGMLSSVQKFRG